MRKLSLTVPKDIQEELCLLCLNQPKKCKKDGSLGWTSNDRIILVSNGYFQYYNLHVGFVQDNPSTLKKKYFKAAVRLDLIHQVNFLPKNKIIKNHLQLIFPKDKKIIRSPLQGQRQEEEGEQIVKAQQELQSWVFQFKQDVKGLIEQKREQQKERQRMMAKLVPLSPTELHLFDSPIIMKKNSQDDHHEKNIEEYVQAIQRTKTHLKSKAELAEEEALRKKKLKEKQQAEIISSKNQSVEQSYAISTFWRQYYKDLERVIKGQKEKQPLQKLLQNQFGLLQTIQYFNTVAIKTVQDYIDQRAIGWNGVQRQFQNFHFYRGLWLRVGGKQLNQQFLVNYYLNDILYSFQQVKQLKFRLPLMSLIKYKGVKVLAMCDMPFSQLQKTEVYNLIDEGYDLQLMGKLKQSLQIIEDVLNIKSEPVQLEPRKKIAAPLGVKMKIFQYNFKKDKGQDQATLPNFYYLINPDIVFPLDFMSQRTSVQPQARLRPELVAFYRDYYRGDDPQLLSQAFLSSSMSEDFKKYEDEKAIDASKAIESYKIKQLAHKLNKIELIFVDSYSIKAIMEQMGINIRYLYLLYDNITLAYLREHILAEALARTIKKQFRTALNQLQSEQLKNSGQYTKMKSKNRNQYMKQKKQQYQMRYKDIAVDYLNLVFGNEHQSTQFWKIIIKNCKKYYKLTSQYPPKIKPGLLLHAVLWHCGLKATFNIDVPLFLKQHPFSQSVSVEFVSKIKTFDFPSFEVQKLFRATPSLNEHLAMDLFRQSSSKLIKLQLMFRNTLRFSFQTQIAMSKLSNFNQFITKVQMDVSWHPIILPYYFSNKSQYNFQRGLQILNFALPQSHPLYISFYVQYAQILQTDLLRKTALMLAVKNYGQFHKTTTQLYSKFYHQGYLNYQIKAMRVGDIQACQKISKQMFDDCRYQSCLAYCLQQINKMNNPDNDQKLGTGNYKIYLAILMQGLQSAVRILQLKKGVTISKEASYVISSFKLRDHFQTYQLFKKTLLIHLKQSDKKYFLYKMVLLVVHIRQRHEKVQYDDNKCLKEVGKEQTEQLLQGLTDSYYQYQNHYNWLGFIIETICKSFQYFNFLQDLFNNYAHHLERYNSDEFRHCFGYFDILIRIYGQSLFKSNLYDVKLD